jgi:hypothetical protein
LLGAGERVITAHDLVERYADRTLVEAVRG